MKKCMSGCGGKMQKGGKVSPVKKMQKGGALKPLGAKIGVGTNIAGMIGMGVKAISDRVKAKKAKKKEKEAASDKKQMGGNVLRRKQPSSFKVTEGKDSVKEFTKNYSPMSPDFNRGKGTGLLNKDEKYNKIREDIEKTTGKKSSLKYQKGGGVQKIVGMPGYNAKTNTMKKGGSAKKFAALAPPYDKATYADKIVGAKKKAKFGASVPVQHSPSPGRVRSSSGVGTVPVGARKQMGGSTKRK